MTSAAWALRGDSVQENHGGGCLFFHDAIRFLSTM